MCWSCAVRPLLTIDRTKRSSVPGDLVPALARHNLLFRSAIREHPGNPTSDARPGHLGVRLRSVNERATAYDTVVVRAPCIDFIRYMLRSAAPSTAVTSWPFSSTAIPIDMPTEATTWPDKMIG